MTMPDTPTPAELLREWDRQIALRLLKDGSPWLISNVRAALSRLAQVERDADQRAAAVLAAPGGLTVHCVLWPESCSEKRVLKERIEKVEQERDASDAVVAKRCAWTTYDSMDERAAVHAAIERHRSRQKAERT